MKCNVLPSHLILETLSSLPSLSSRPLTTKSPSTIEIVYTTEVLWKGLSTCSQVPTSGWLDRRRTALVSEVDLLFICGLPIPDDNTKWWVVGEISHYTQNPGRRSMSVVAILQQRCESPVQN